jgi:NAD(P)-dependent dehydrogenase (short-subunit alcohol dehydrogenase family)
MAGGALAGKVVVVTGGSRGIGRAIAEACASDGAFVVAASRSAPGLPPEIRAGEITPARLDVTDEPSVEALFAWLDETMGWVDALVNNAGVGVFKPIDALGLDEWRAVIDTNLTGAFLCSREAFRRMKAAGGGRIVTMGSIADRTALVHSGAYGASKHGARGLMQVLTEEGKAHGVFATHLSLGAVATAVWNGRDGFDPGDMLSVGDVARCVTGILRQSPSVRVDEVHLSPPKGVL